MTVFAQADQVVLVPPSYPLEGGPSGEELRSFRALLEREHREFEVELGAPASVATDYEGAAAKFVLGPRAANPVLAALDPPRVDRPTLALYRGDRLLVADAPDLAGVEECLSLLRTLTSSNADRVEAIDCGHVDDVVDRVVREVAVTYPAFDLRGLDWQEICARHVEQVHDAPDVLGALQRWIADLGDMHSAVHREPPDGILPYTVRVTGHEAVVVDVPEWSQAWALGVRQGDRIEHPPTGDIWERTGAPPHCRPLLAGRRLLAGPTSQPRHVRVRTTDGRTVEFDEQPSYQPWPSPVEARRLPSGTGYLRLRGFTAGVNDLVDGALADLAPTDRLIVDLRGNAGGALVEAFDFRDRFLDRARQTGWVRFSTPSGGLSPPAPVEAEPAPPRRRWTGEVRFLTDGLTASASEDAILGVAGLPHVQILGTATGGGSGRARNIRLLPGMRLTVSIALTYDRDGHCVENQGIQPDIRVDESTTETDEIIRLADDTW